MIARPPLGRPPGFSWHGVAGPAGEIVVVAGPGGMDANGAVAGAEVESQTKQALADVTLARAGRPRRRPVTPRPAPAAARPGAPA